MASATFIIIAYRFINLRVSKIVKEGTITRLQGGIIIKKLEDVPIGLRNVPAVSDFLHVPCSCASTCTLPKKCVQIGRPK